MKNDLRSIDEYQFRLIENMKIDKNLIKVSALRNGKFLIMFTDSVGITLTEEEAKHLLKQLEENIFEIPNIIKRLA